MSESNAEKIRAMQEKGTITKEQAEELLAALAGDPGADQAEEEPAQGRERRHGRDRERRHGRRSGEYHYHYDYRWGPEGWGANSPGVSWIEQPQGEEFEFKDNRVTLTKLRDVRLVRSRMNDNTFSASSAHDIDLADSSMEHNSMSAASVHDLRMDHGEMERSSFSGTKLKDVSIRGQSAIRSCDFAGCSVSDLALDGEAEAGGSLLKGVRFSGAKLSDITLKGSSVEECDLSGSVLHEVRMQRSSLTGCKLRGSRLRRVEVISSRAEGCRLDAMGFDNFRVENATLTNVQLLGSLEHFRKQAQDLVIRDSTLDGIVFDGCILQGTRILGVKASGLRISDKDLSGMTIDSAEALEKLAQK